MDITPELSATVLDAVPVVIGGVTIHEITDQVRGTYPAIRITEVAQVLLALRADGKVRFIGPGTYRRYARRV